METAQGIYQNLESDRYMFLDRARDGSKLTIPFLMPPLGHSPANRLPTPYQGIGAKAVNNLASKLLLALLPPNAPFFRLTIDRGELNKAQAELGQEQASGLRTELERALSEIEKSVSMEIETNAIRVGAYEAIRNLIVTGNALIYMDKSGQTRVFRLDRYVVKRDPMGNILKIVTQETISHSALPEEIRSQYANDKEANCDLYTAIVREGEDTFRVWQEIKGTVLPDTETTYTEEKLPYIALRFNRIDGESYGRGYVEEYLGDLRSLEGLSRALLEGSAAASRLLFLNNPNGVTNSDDIVNAPNGGVIEGLAQDVVPLQLQKYNDFRVALETSTRIEERVSQAFLINSGVVRRAERVTAEEIRMLSQELESALGGLYSLQAQEFQLPLVRLLMNRMTQEKRLPKLPKGIVKPAITTGVEALGRGNDLNRLDMFLAGANQVVGPQAVQQVLSIPEYFKRRATALGIETENLVKSEEQLAQEQQQQQMMMMASQLGKPAIETASAQYMQQQEMAERAQQPTE
jgi:hypothetical protein